MSRLSDKRMDLGACFGAIRSSSDKTGKLVSIEEDCVAVTRNQIAKTVVGNVLHATSNVQRPPQNVCDDVAQRHIDYLRGQQP